MKTILTLALISSVAVLASCASEPKRDAVIKGSPFERADVNADTFIDYKEYKNYLFYKTEPNTAERDQLRREVEDGYIAHHKRFLMLDTNNDGKLSLIELGGA